MNLFNKPKAMKPETPPSIDEAQQRVDQMRRGQRLRGRAATMLTAGKTTAPTAQRQAMGN